MDSKKSIVISVEFATAGCLSDAPRVNVVVQRGVTKGGDLKFQERFYTVGQHRAEQLVGAMARRSIWPKPGLRGE
jgi:hypothetical protein